MSRITQEDAARIMFAHAQAVAAAVLGGITAQRTNDLKPRRGQPVVDPPALVKRRDELQAAEQAFADLVARMVEPEPGT